MTTQYNLKPFRFNLSDLTFIRDQINFRPLFDAAGNPVIAWDGTGAVYNSNNMLTRSVLWDGIYATGATGIHNAAEAIAAFGTSYDTITAAQGLREVTGNNNNLHLTNHYWGAVDQPFMQSVPPDFTQYIKPVAPGADAFYGNKVFGSTTTGLLDYTKSGDVIGTPAIEGHAGTSIVDYTPRMISRTITTGGATPLQDPTGQVVHFYQAQYDSDPIYAALVDTVSGGGAGLIEGAAIMKTLGVLGLGGAQHDPQDPTNTELFFGAINPGVAPGNSFLAYFGQFFDHGLDFIGKGADGTKISIPLALDDPLYRAPNPMTGDPGNTKITVSRADVSGFDANGNAQWINHTSPFIDQSQTYGSHAEMTTLLREWVTTDGTNYHAGAHLLDGNQSAAWVNGFGETTNATLPTLNELRTHLLATGRDDLSWADVLDLRQRDATGHVVAGGTGTGQALLLDMNPHFDTTRLSAATQLALHDLGIDPGAGGVYALGGPPGSLTLGNLIDFRSFTPLTPLAAEILMESVGDHYLAGDGRVNENIGLTTIHHVFHEEHNYQVRNIENAILEQDARAVVLGDSTHSVAHYWQADTSNGIDAAGNFLTADGKISWDEGKLFDAAKLTVEMEYQHAAVDQYARTITPDIPEFVGYNSGTNATVSLEYAQGAFRFGHSTMRETIDYLDPAGGITGKVMSIALEQAFLNPALFAQKGAASIAMGLTHQQMNEIDELLTPAMNQGLLGQPLDLAAINIARGRDIGLATLNDFREGVGLLRYTSWSDFGANMVHPESLVNFIAAYSFDGDVSKAAAIIGLENGSLLDGDVEAMGYTLDQAIAFLNGDVTIAGADGFNHIDTWIGGMAEVHVMGGLLGETFNLVFVDQINRLMDGDRFYYLYRLNNMNLGDEIGNAQLKDIVERNTGLEHLNGSVFAYADQYVDLSAKVDPTHTTGDFRTDHKYGDLVAAATMGVYSTAGTSTNGNGAVVTINGVQYLRDIRAEGSNGNANVNGSNLDGTPDTGANSNEVLIGTDHNDLIYMMAGDDTAYGEGGNDIIFGGAGIDRLYGGDGADTIYGGDSGDLIDGGAGDDTLYGDSSGSAAAGVDQIIGGDGNDILYGGIGIDKLSGGRGDDVIFGGGDTDAFTHGGDGNDYIDGQSDGDLLWGDGGDDLVVGGNNQDIVAGNDGDDILRPGNPSSASGGGPDEVLGGDGTSDLGNDGKGLGFDLIDFSDYVTATSGVNADFATQTNPLVAIDGSTPFPAWVGIEGFIGSRNNDIAKGDDANNWLIGGSGKDSLEGGAGNDLLIGDGVRLDSLIGTYSGTYDNEFDGATHRAVGFIQDNGLLGNAALGTTLFDKHFTEMLKSNLFKNLELGGSALTTLPGGGTTGDGGSAATGGAAGSDVAVFSGTLAEYSFARVDFTDAHGTAFTALKVIDSVAGRDGTDLLVGIELATFAGGAPVDISVYSNHQPMGAASVTLAGGTEDIAYTVTAVALLTGFTDIDGNALSVQNLTANHGTVTLNPGGLSFKITPDLNYNGPVTLNYQVSDGLVGVAATQSFTLSAVNDAPVLLRAQAALAAGQEDITYVVSAADLLDGFTDPDAGDVMSVINLQASGGGTVVDLGTGFYQITQAANFNGTVNLTYSVTDGHGGTVAATQSFNLTAVNDAPVGAATAVLAAGTEDTAYTVSLADLLAGFSDVDGDTLSVSALTSSNGAVAVNLDGSYTITPTANYNGPVSLTYTVGDGHGGTVTASQSYSLTATPDATVGAVTINNLAPDLLRTLTVSNSLSDPDGALSPVTYQWQSSPNGTNTWSNIVGATGASFTTDTSGVQLRVVASYSVAGGPVETMTSTAITAAVGAFHIVLGTNPAGQTLNGTIVADQITGLGGNDRLNGLAGDDILNGGAGSDVLTGGSGNDTMIGGLGNDTYVVSEAGDVVTEAAGEGTDTVWSTISYALTANVESLVLSTAIGNVSGTGNALNNLIIGNSGDNVLDGGAGNDNLQGGLGNDTYVVSEVGDTVSEGIGAGTDAVYTSLSTYTLGANLENLAFTGTGMFQGTGNALNNQMLGGTSGDLLRGGAGNDTMSGGFGNDTYIVTETGDVVVEGLDAGLDTVWSTVSYTLSANVESLVLSTAIGNVSGTGNGLNNLIIGNSANNTINGGAGRDTLTGNAGSDTFLFSALSDSGVGGALRDVITDFLSGTDRIDLSALDANAAALGNQAFTMINTAAFGGVAGQLRYGFSAGTTIIEGDVDGNGIADFQVQLTGTHSFVPADILL